MKLGQKAVNWATAHLGIPYNAGGDRLTDPPENHSTDCSGFVWRALRHGAGLPFPPVTSSADAAWCYYSRGGGKCLVSDALANPGALLFMGASSGLAGYGPSGHVALAIGDGSRVVETPSKGHRSGISNAAGRRWSGAGFWPGHDIDDLHVPAPPPVDWKAIGNILRTEAIKKLEAYKADTIGPGSTNFYGVIAVQDAVNLAIHCALKLDGDYGPLTQGAVLWFQRVFFAAMPWKWDSTVSPDTNAALRYNLALQNNQP